MNPESAWITIGARKGKSAMPIFTEPLYPWRRLFGRVFSYLFTLPQWQIGFAEGNLDSVVAGGDLPLMTWWPPSKAAVFNADPFFIGEEVVFERMSRWRGRADLRISRIDGSESRLFLREPGHISYPFTIDENGALYLIYESAVSLHCKIMMLSDMKWIEVSCISEPVVDATMVSYNNRYWIFGTLANGEENRALHIWWSDSIMGPWKPHPMNPVKRDISSCRPAGGIFRSAEGLIRPAQDCSSTYGGSIALCRIDRLDECGFEETVLRRVGPLKPYDAGIHTINTNGKYIVVDGKRTVTHPFAALLRWKCRRGMRLLPSRNHAAH